ncbi:hypothetical protein FS842_007152, partial [Serendipita sp. 407]
MTLLSDEVDHVGVSEEHDARMGCPALPPKRPSSSSGQFRQAMAMMAHTIPLVTPQQAID